MIDSAAIKRWILVPLLSCPFEDYVVLVILIGTMSDFFRNLKAAEPVVNALPLLRDLELSRIYNGKRNKKRCPHISGRMAHRLFLQGEILKDHFREYFESHFIDRLFKEIDWDGKVKKIYIKQRYLDYMTHSDYSDTFNKLIIHYLYRMLFRLAKGYGFECNCIAEILIAWIIIIEAQTVFVIRQELDHFEPLDRFDDNTWQFLKKNEKLDANFLLVYERELSLNISKSLNNVCAGVYKYILDEGEMCVNIEREETWDKEYENAENIMDAKQHNRRLLHEYVEQLKILDNHRYELIDYIHPKIGNLHLIKSLDLNNIHPSKWFIPSNEEKANKFTHESTDFKAVRVRKRCIVCKRRKEEAKIEKFKKCKRCKQPLYCGKKCQKYHWNHGHKINSWGFRECLYHQDVIVFGRKKADRIHYFQNRSENEK